MSNAWEETVTAGYSGWRRRDGVTVFLGCLTDSWRIGGPRPDHPARNDERKFPTAECALRAADRDYPMRALEADADDIRPGTPAERMEAVYAAAREQGVHPETLAETFGPVEEYVDDNPKTAYGDRKPPVHLIPPVALVAEAGVFKLGARKYGPYNWRERKVSSSVYQGAALRHLLAWWDGEDTDPESGESHLAHVRACMGILLDAQASGNLNDNRPVSGAAGERIRAAEEK